MTKKKTDDTNTAALTADYEKTSELALAAEEMSSFEGAGTGTVDMDDIKLPRLVVAQDVSPQRKRSNPLYMPDLESGELFNDLTSETYPQGTKAVVVTYLGKRAVHFSTGGGVEEFNVPLDSPKCQFTDNPTTGKREKPVATVFADYLLYLPETAEMVLWSAKSTSLKTAKKLNSLLRLPLRLGTAVIARPPAWARTYELSTAEVPGDNPHYAVSFRPAGVTAADVRAQCAALHSEHRNLEVTDVTATEAGEYGGEREPGDEDIPF